MFLLLVTSVLLQSVDRLCIYVLQLNILLLEHIKGRFTCSVYVSLRQNVEITLLQLTAYWCHTPWNLHLQICGQDRLDFRRWYLSSGRTGFYSSDCIWNVHIPSFFRSLNSEANPYQVHYVSVCWETGPWEHRDNLFTEVRLHLWKAVSWLCCVHI